MATEGGRMEEERAAGSGYDDEASTRVGARARSMDPGMGSGPMYGGYGGGWGYGRGFMPRPQFPTETKPFFLTSEFFGVLIAIVAMAISAASDDAFDARLFWILTAVLVSAYVLSRGVAKSGTKSRAADPREQLFQREARGPGSD